MMDYKDMTKAQRAKADRVTGKIMRSALRLADEEYSMKESGDAYFSDYERGGHCTFVRGGIEYIVTVSSRRGGPLE
jgi:hypothetical protein